MCDGVVCVLIHEGYKAPNVVSRFLNEVSAHRFVLFEGYSSAPGFTSFRRKLEIRLAIRTGYCARFV
jgi:hypothetical protein